MNYTVGIDSGSTATKGILLADGVIVRRFLCPTPFAPPTPSTRPGRHCALASRRRLFNPHRLWPPAGGFCR